MVRERIPTHKVLDVLKERYGENVALIWKIAKAVEIPFRANNLFHVGSDHEFGMDGQILRLHDYKCYNQKLRKMIKRQILQGEPYVRKKEDIIARYRCLSFPERTRGGHVVLWGEVSE